MIVVDNPVGPAIVGLAGEHRSSLRPDLAGVALDVVELDQPRLPVGLEDLEGAIGRPVVADQEQVDSLRAVVAEVGLDQVLGIPNEDCHRESHGAPPL